MAMNKTIKIDNETLHILDNLKPEYTKKYPETYLSYDFIINQLLYEHEVINSPERKEEEKKKLLQDYVSKDNYDDVYSKMVDLEKKLRQLSEEHEIGTKKLTSEIDKLKEDLISEKEKHKGKILKLDQELKTEKQKRLSLNQKNNELSEEVRNLKNDLETLNKVLDKCESDYGRLKFSVDNDYVTIESVRIMYYIEWFLLNHKRKMYSIPQLIDKLYYFTNKRHYFSSEDIRRALSLIELKVFQVKYFKQGGIDYICFDRKYLR